MIALNIKRKLELVVCEQFGQQTRWFCLWWTCPLTQKGPVFQSWLIPSPVMCGDCSLQDQCSWIKMMSTWSSCRVSVWPSICTASWFTEFKHSLVWRSSVCEGLWNQLLSHQKDAGLKVSSLWSMTLWSWFVWVPLKCLAWGPFPKHMLVI